MPAAICAAFVPTVPPPVATAKVIVRPDTPLPNASVTFTTSGCASSVLGAAVCRLPETMAIVVAEAAFTVNPAEVTLP